MQDSAQTQKKERRIGSDRRGQAVEHDFPFIDSHGHLVTEERRMSDRRSSNPTGSVSKPKNKEKSYA